MGSGLVAVVVWPAATIDPFCWRRLQSETTYCAAFYASLTPVAGSGNTGEGYGGKNVGLLVRYARMSFG